LVEAPLIDAENLFRQPGPPLYPTIYPGTITVSGNDFSHWTGADVSTWDANYTFANGGAGVTLTDQVTASGQEIDTVQGWTGGTISLDAGFDTALGAVQNGNGEVDVYLSNGDEIIVQGTHVSANTIAAMLGAPVVQNVVTIGSNTTGTVGNGSNLVLIGSNDTVTIGNGSDTVIAGDGNHITVGNGSDNVTAGINSVIQGGNGHDTVSAGGGSTITLGNGTDMVTVGDGSSAAPNVITLGNGSNTIIAGAYTTISVGNGSNTIYAASHDTITVGNGHDTFVFGDTPGQTALGKIGPVTITDFNTAKDVININPSFESYASTHISGSTITLDASGDTITLTGVNASNVHIQFV
jgi:hypothetical protein